MTIRTSVDASKRFVCLRYDAEEPPPQETLAAVLAILSDPELPSDVGILVDRRALAAPPSTDRVHLLTAALARHAELLRNRRIAVVYLGQATYGMLRMAQMLLTDTPATLAFFATIEEAEAWLRAMPPSRDLQ